MCGFKRSGYCLKSYVLAIHASRLHQPTSLSAKVCSKSSLHLQIQPFKGLNCTSSFVVSMRWRSQWLFDVHTMLRKNTYRKVLLWCNINTKLHFSWHLTQVSKRCFISKLHHFWQWSHPVFFSNYMIIIFLQYFPNISLRYIACDSIYVHKKQKKRPNISLLTLSHHCRWAYAQLVH